MRILIIYASAGQGHKRCAEAIYDYLRKKSSHQLNLINSLDYTNCLFKLVYTKGYAFLITYFASLWSFCYRLTDKPANTFLNSFLRFLNNLIFPKLKAYLRKENPDVIISTHFFANDCISNLKRENLISNKFVCVITDFLAHHYWLSDSVDTYLVACEKTNQQLLSFGVKEEKVKISGIPVDMRFSQEFDRNIICQSLSLNPHKFSVLVATGAFGFSSIESVTRLLKDDVQLLIVCGNNKKLFQKLSLIQQENLKIFGLVNNMHELMSVVDIIITKPGGLTISEALVKNLPMIFISAIAGQETNNAKFFEAMGLGLIAKNISQIKEFTLQFKNNRDYLEQFKARLAQFSKTNATQDLLEVV